MSCVLFTEHATQDNHLILEISLNSERSLNALTLEMIELIQPRLTAAANDERVKAVLLTSAGEKAFCAGGDVVGLYKSITSGEQPNFPENYFTREYQLDYQIHTYPKPIICWASGIVMGGGMGLMNGCSHRVVTQTSHLAMPEVTIGLYPDVGGSFFLNRMPGRTGLFLGLTGNPIYAADAIFLGLADRFVDAGKYGEMVAQLQASDWSGDAYTKVTQVLRAFEQNSTDSFRADSPIQNHFAFIQQITDQDSLSDLMSAMHELESDDPWIQRSKKAISHGSPLSVHIIAEQLQRSRHLSLKEVFMAELVLSVQCCRNRELPEGVRALLIDKDGSPDWIYKTVQDVNSNFVAQFFESPWSENPLASL
ncbi:MULTISPECIES: enoyl-CoA hydratase/isomerase family protein [unclassified Marinobacterium]|uniref:enoyl-CoA hydratase/isomerase family protein n=1 Tax=unclassified Marinobacterium TaxID=2644139 RepID=UPI0015685CF2|nr:MULTISPECIES: enoyl-CoA hydratase/isomerase family protein [unclassified Marinobacterium]